MPKTKKQNGKRKGRLGAVYNVDTQALRTPAIILTTAIVVGATVWWLSRERKKVQQRNTQDDIVETGTNANIAERLRRAMGSDYDGTDENEVMQAVSEVKTKSDWEKVEKAYANLTGGTNLNDKLSRELSNTNWETVQAILQLRPENGRQQASSENAKTIVKMLVDGIGYTHWISFYQNDVDIELVMNAILMIADKAQYEAVKREFRTQTGRDFWEALENEPKLATTLFFSLTDYFSNTYAGKGSSYLSQIKENIERRFGTL